MQRIFVYTFFIVFLVSNVCNTVFALGENEIENIVNNAKSQIDSDYWNMWRTDESK